MTKDSIEPIEPEEEPIQDSSQASEGDLGNQDYVSELRGTLGKEEANETPVRKTGFFERFKKRSKKPAEEPVESEAGPNDALDDINFDIITTNQIDTEDMSSAVSLIEGEGDIMSPSSSTFDDVDFTESSQPEVIEAVEDELVSADEEIQLLPAPPEEENSQWKSFLATLWRQPQPDANQEALDDETLASRVERSLPYESQAEKEWGKPEEASPFMFDKDQRSSDPPDGKKITGSLVFDEGEEIFSEGDGNIWGGLRQELQEAEEETIPEDIPEINQMDEDIPLSNAAFSGWKEAEHDEAVAESGLSLEVPNFESDEVEKPEEDNLPEYISRPFSEEFSHVFGETVEEEIPPETHEQEPSVEDIRTIVLEDYEEPQEDARIKAGTKASKRWLRVILLLLVASLLAFVAVYVTMPSLLPWMRTATPLPAAVEAPTAIPMEGMPYPTGMKMTGGWFFYLQPSTIREGNWEPESGEWLNGSELRRVVALPWTRQLEAVVRSLVPGDTIELHMSNGDILNYLVEEASLIDRSDVSIITSNTPSLALILFQQEEEQRWVVISNLNE
jgi:hypothetical protein